MTTPQPHSLRYDTLKSLLAPRARDAHKGHFGHVLVIGGAQGFGGAAFMAAETAARCGAGLVSVATHPSHALAYLPRRPELMCRGIQTAEDLDDLLDRASVLVLGPGLGQSAWSVSLFNRVIQAQVHLERPMVLDADGLNIMSRGHGGHPQAFMKEWVLTPHPAEAARLLGIPTTAVQQNRVESILALQQRFHATVVLKGAGSLVASPGESAVERCDAGNPGMASGGTGDVLTGVIAGLLAQGLSPPDAARFGVCVHAMAGDRCAQESGQRGLLATDLLPHLRNLVNPA